MDIHASMGAKWLFLHSEDLVGYQPNMYERRWWCLISSAVPRFKDSHPFKHPFHGALAH